jgi:putative Holliday junction resolvase
MARILGIDWGAKRTGVAVTDPLQIICSPLDTIETVAIIPFLKKYCEEETVEAIVVGEPLHMDGAVADTAHKVYAFVEILKTTFPDLEIALQDERLTSKSALQIMRNSGLKKKQQHDKKRLDRISAALILETFVEKRKRF